MGKGTMGMGTKKSMNDSMREYEELNKKFFAKRHDKLEEILKSLDGGSHSTEKEKLESEDMTIEEILKARADGSHSTNTSHVIPKKFPRPNKNSPMEMSSKVWVSTYREVVQVPKKRVRDPRFDSLSNGTFDPEGFKKRYSFLVDEEYPKEKERLRKLIEKSKDPNVIEESKNQISLIDRQIKTWFGNNRSESEISSEHIKKEREATKKGKKKWIGKSRPESEILSEHIKKEREAVKKGKRPYYLKKSEIRERKIINKYNELKAAGKLDSYIEKRLKRNASKDHRYMPYRRSDE